MGGYGLPTDQTVNNPTQRYIVGAPRPRQYACRLDRTVFGTALRLFRTLKVYNIWYQWKAMSVGFRFALIFCMSHFSIKCYGCMTKNCRKKREKKPKNFLVPYIYIQTGIDFSVLKWLYILIMHTKKSWGCFIKK